MARDREELETEREGWSAGAESEKEGEWMSNR
jgi:hypothetical protein